MTMLITVLSRPDWLSTYFSVLMNGNLTIKITQKVNILFTLFILSFDRKSL